MPDATGLKGLLMTAGEYMPKSKKADINLPDEKKKKKGFLDRFTTSPDKDKQGAINRMRELATKK